MESWLDKKMEAENNDPYKVFNQQKGVRPPSKIHTDEEVELIAEYLEGIKNSAPEKKDNENYKEGEENYQTPKEIKNIDKARVADSKNENYKIYKNSRNNFGRKPEYKDKPSGIKNFWNKLTGKE